MYDIDDLQRGAKEILDRATFDYFVGGAGDEITIAENTAAWSSIHLRPHVLRDVSEVSTAISLLGTNLETPVLIPPLGYMQLAHDRGEVAMAEGAAGAGALMCVSTMATISMEKVAGALHAAHLSGVVHRDVKPANIMVQEGEEPMVLDFGVGKGIDDDRRFAVRH